MTGGRAAGGPGPGPGPGPSRGPGRGVARRGLLGTGAGTSGAGGRMPIVHQPWGGTCRAGAVDRGSGHIPPSEDHILVSFVGDGLYLQPAAEGLLGQGL